MRFQYYLSVAITLITKYDGAMPLAFYLKKYFSDNKKHGSKDRKYISHVCYCYYRLGKSADFLDIEEKIKVALFLCNNEVGVWSSLFNDEWIHHWHEKLNVRIEFILQKFSSFSVENIFPFVQHLSNDIASSNFCISHLVQPNLFVRIRPSHSTTVIQKLKNAKLDYQLLNETCIALPNASKINDVLNINQEVVIQDYSSQQIASFLQLIPSTNKPISIWDCCAASGGKSILAKDVFSHITLTVSDVRKTIVQNLHHRFIQAGINHYQSFIADIASNKFDIPKTIQQKFQLIICDVPCSGSGTWSRTPEQIIFFTAEKMNEYAALQKSIINNAIKHVEPNGYFLYITCSVFKKENEEIVQYIQENFSFELIKMNILQGFEKKADTMFAALFSTKENN
ncbi:MAG: Fmu (Sun) domain-containing protein [Chitinophagaceae bacterium]|nr:Fmu (Sun) domain-containing protein [Chitinophagaceae bacterium]MCW5904691.1 Fmu (Sun) domain-containing protein [Chitinophagaceae bacterium]